MRYFIHFTSMHGGTKSDGNTMATVAYPIESQEDIEAIEATIKREQDFDSVVVTNFIEFRGR